MTKRQTPRRQDAKLHEVDRRAFVKLGVAGGLASLVAACGWDGGRLLRPGLLDISRVNDWVGEKILFSPTRLARTYSTAERSAMLPSYFISTMTPMLEDPAAWRLRVDGLVARPLELSLDDLMQLPRLSYTVKHHCVEGWSAIASWHGAPVSAIVERCRPLQTARYINFVSFDADYSNGWDMASAMHPQTILASNSTSGSNTSSAGAASSGGSRVTRVVVWALTATRVRTRPPAAVLISTVSGKR